MSILKNTIHYNSITFFVMLSALLALPAVMCTQANSQNADKKLSITIVYDNTTTDSLLKADWGFSAYIIYGSDTLLFDSGAKGAILLANLRKLNINIKSIATVVLSHKHYDHVDGMDSLLAAGIHPKLYFLASFPDSIKNRYRGKVAIVEVIDTLQIFPGLYTTGELASSIAPEEALVFTFKRGGAVLTGCAHPGIVEIVKKSQAITKINATPILVGGFHLFKSDIATINGIIQSLQALHIQKIVPVHCTGDTAIALFKKAYGNEYQKGGVGAHISVF
jgi:7,8-dihydropterin-6-yl-methyl-4-(beta-D-ribofuranosyl)aminobenzene 5'-phosphate synthase